MHPPNAKAHSHHGPMVAAGMSGTDTTVTTHTIVVQTRETSTAGHALHDRNAARVRLRISSLIGCCGKISLQNGMLGRKKKNLPTWCTARPVLT